jgi:hypothetical protein
MEISKIVMALNAKKCGVNEWRASCPAHTNSGTNPSLSIALKGENILLYCHAGCSFNEIKAAIGFDRAVTKKHYYDTNDYAGRWDSLMEV